MLLYDLKKRILSQKTLLPAEPLYLFYMEAYRYELQ